MKLPDDNYNAGMKLPIIIDPYLNWKTKGRQRTARRPRTSFSFGNNTRRSVSESLKECGDPIHKEPTRTGDTSISKSKKFGASILGQRLVDALAFVPNRKNRDRSVCPPSSPSHVSSHLDELGDDDKFASDRSVIPKESEENISCLPDFSGISLLASVACDNNVADGIMNPEASKNHSSEGEIFRSAELHVSAKLKDEQISNNTCGNLDIIANTISSSHNAQNDECRKESSFCNNRLHWDLNIEIELWQHPHEVANANSAGVDVVCDEKFVNTEEQFQPELVDSRVHLSDTENVCVLEGSKVPDNPVFSCDSSVAYHHKEGDSASISRIDDPALEEHHFVDVAKADSDEKELLYGPEMTPAVNASTSEEKKTASTSEEEKTGAYHVSTRSMMENVTTSSHLILSKNALTSHASEAHFRLDSSTVAELETDSDGLSLGKTRAENNVSLHIDSETSKIDQHSISSHFVEGAPGLLAERNGAHQIPAHRDAISGEGLHIDALTFSAQNHIDTSKLSMALCLSDSSPLTCQRTSNHDELSSGSTSGARIKLDKCSTVAATNLDARKCDDASHIGSKISICHLVGTPDAPLLDGALSSHETCKSYVDSYMNSTGEVALENLSDCDYNSYASQTCNDQEIGLEKVEIMTDEDSQYEDGEFRGSIKVSWGDDETADGESELVDHVSRTVVEDSSLQFDKEEHKNSVLSDAGHTLSEAAQIGKYTQGPLTKEISGAGHAKRSAGNFTETLDGIQKFERDARDAGDGKVFGPTETLKVSDGVRDSIHSKNCSESSGWDQNHEGCKSFRNRVGDFGCDTDNKDQTAPTFVASSVSESSRRVAESTSTEDLLSKIEGPRSSEFSLRKDKYYRRTSRSDGVNRPNLGFEDVDNGRSSNRGRISLRMRGRGGLSADSCNKWDHPRYHVSPGSNRPPNFTNHGPKDIGSAVAARLESNGFVISADGTIIKAAGSTGALRRCVSASSQRAAHSVLKRSRTERDEAFGMPQRHGNLTEVKRGRSDCRKRYKSPVPYHRSSSGRKQSLSPHRRPPHLSRSHTRSPSRSITHSPTWTPPGDYCDRKMSRNPDLHRPSRSPTFSRPEVARKRMGFRMRSHNLRPGFKRTVGFAPSSRNDSSPPHASRRIDERMESLDRVRGHGYMRSSGRIPPTSGFSQDQ